MDRFDDATAPTVPAKRAASRESFAESAKGESSAGAIAAVGRYIIVDEIGRGGMGAVYAANDHKLDRRVALKLLHASASDCEGKRLQREAMALARLSHPNVINVYDTGVYKGRVFIAMELIDGESLDRWSEREPRPGWRDVLGVYLQAARGIAAAHEQGLIHRDIKPANILVGKDGRVRVADFGLAKAHEQDTGMDRDPAADSSTVEDSSTAEDSSTVEDSGSPRGNLGRSRLNQRLTATGVAMGTPVFMAPECFAGEFGPAADQYSFCVSLYRDLYRRLPFAVERPGHDLAALVRDKMRGQSALPPSDSEVPAWLYPLVVRGLAPEPAQRYPSMNALIAVLQDDPAQRRKARARLAAFAGVALTAVVAWSVLGWTELREDSGPVCQGVERELEHVWNDQLGAHIRAAFVGTGLSYAADTYDRVSVILDDYAGRWTAMRIETCRATQVERKQSDKMMYRRIACLNRRRDQLATLVELLARSVDRALVAKAVSAARDLPPIDYCGDVEALTAAVPPPEDPRLRARVEAVQPEVDRLRVLFDTGKYHEGVEQGEALLTDMAALDHAPTRAQTLFWTGILKDAVGDHAGAESMLRAAIQMAARAKDDVLVARTWGGLVAVIAQGQGRPRDVQPLLQALDAATERADDDLVRASSLYTVAGVFLITARHREARTTLESCLAIREKILGSDHPEVAITLNNLAIALQELGEYKQAVASYQRALAIEEKALGRDHPDLAISLNNLGVILVYMGEYEQAVASYQRALAIKEKAFGPDHPYSMYPLAGLGRALVRAEKPRAAGPYLERALLTFEKAYGPDHPELAWPLLIIGEFHLARQKPAESVKALQRALALDDQAYRAEIQLTLARALWAAGNGRKRAIELAGAARDHYHRLGNQLMLDRAVRWLAEHPLAR